MIKIFAIMGLLTVITGCAEQFDHDADLAGRRAVEFAEAVFVHRNMDQGYALLADKARSYVPMDKFVEKVNQIHRSGYPDQVKVLGAVPVQGEKLVNVKLWGQGRDGTFEYAIALTGTAATDYRVASFNGRGGS